jgi:outer membrane protein assembly factor BamB
MYQHDARNTGTVESTGPKEEVDVAWKFETGGALKTQPTVVDGTVYLPSTDTRLYAVSTDSGKEQWSVGTNGPLINTPAVGDGIVYLTTSNGRIYALSAGTGSGQWTIDGNQFADPTLYENTLICVDFGNSSNLIQIDATSGEQRWAVERSPEDMRMPARGPAVHDERVYIQSTYWYTISPYDIDTGEKSWKGEPKNEGGPVTSVTVGDGAVYVGLHGDADGEAGVALLDKESGERKWLITAVGKPTGPLPFDGDRLYLSTKSNKLHAIDPNVGTIQWTTELGGRPSTPTVTDGVVYVGCGDNNVYAFDATDGSQLWSFATGNSVVAAPVVLDGTVYAASTDGYLYALKKKTELGPSDVTGNGNAPTDPDGDGLYEDVNGDGSFTILDVQALYANLDSAVVQDNAEKFDFNGDGQVDLNDVQALYAELRD